VLDSGESQKEVIWPDFNRAIMIDFQGATISSDTGFILLREVDERFRIIDPMKDCLEDLRSPAHTKHALVQMVRPLPSGAGLGSLSSLTVRHPRVKGAGMLNLLEKLLCLACRLTNSSKFVLSCLPRDSLATKEETFRG
jgi:hypothetical protein